MPQRPRVTAETLRDVLARFDIEAQSMRAVAAGRVNRHWRIEARGQSYALRRYETPAYLPRTRTAASISFEHSALRHAAQKGWPVAQSMAARDGGTLVEHEGELYALFPWLSGRPAPRTRRYLRIKGRLLSRLHRDMASFPIAEQRPGFTRVWELDYVFGSDMTFNEMLRDFAEGHRDAAWTVRRQRYANLRELSRLGYGDVPDTFVHFDFHHDNLLFEGGQLTGLLDFDTCHLDARVVDLAQSIALDCLEPPTYHTIDAGAMRALVTGYVEGSTLTERELSLIVPLLRSWIVAAAAGRIAQWRPSGGDPSVLAKIMRTVGQRIPAFEQRRSELEEAVRAAALEGARA